jgi:hypothetical protein
MLSNVKEDLRNTMLDSKMQTVVLAKTKSLVDLCKEMDVEDK